MEKNEMHTSSISKIVQISQKKIVISSRHYIFKIWEFINEKLKLIKILNKHKSTIIFLLLKLKIKKLVNIDKL